MINEKKYLDYLRMAYDLQQYIDIFPRLPTYIVIWTKMFEIKIVD
jgi:hypothetical protein